jgi:hypothetical protein
VGHVENPVENRAFGMVAAFCRTEFTERGRAIGTSSLEQTFSLSPGATKFTLRHASTVLPRSGRSFERLLPSSMFERSQPVDHQRMWSGLPLCLPMVFAGLSLLKARFELHGQSASRFTAFAASSVREETPTFAKML